MKLKYNNFLIITPVFFLLGLALASFNFYLEKKEVIWSIEEELKSVTIATAIFLENSYEDEEKVLKSFERLRSFNKVKRLVLFKDKNPLISSVDEGLSLSKKNYHKIKTYHQSAIYQDNNMSLVDAHIPLKEEGLSLMLSLDVSDAQRNLHTELIEAIVIVGILSFLGLVISIIITFIVTRKIFMLKLMAQSLSSGKYNTNLNMGSVKEFTDLAQTLDIMKSILQEMLFKTRNSYFQDDLFFRDEALVHKCHENTQCSKVLESKGFEVSLINSSALNARALYNLFEDENSIYIYYASIKASKYSALQESIQAQSLNLYLQAYVQENTFDLEELKSIYDIEYLRLIRINKKDDSLEEVFCDRHSDTDESYKVKPDEVYVITNFKEIQKKYEHYIQAYKDLSLQELSKDLESIYPSTEIVILISKKSS